MTFSVEDTGKGKDGPVSGTVRKNGLVLSVQIPTLPETGKLVEGGMGAQARLSFEKLDQAMRAAGGSLADVMMVQVYIVESADWAAMHQVWCDMFEAPFPTRATVVVKELMIPGMLIEIIAHAHLD